MNSYTLDFPEIGEIKVTKKRGMRSIRIRITADGRAVVSAPYSVPKSFITSFVMSKKDWIVQNAEKDDIEIRDGLAFGRFLTLHIHDQASSNRSKLAGNKLNIYLKDPHSSQDIAQKKYILSKMIKTMTDEAEAILLPRLLDIAQKTGLDFNQAFVKRVTSKWGSCDQSKNITLNIFLTQIDNKLVDYVIVHELCHTNEMNHSPVFWENVSEVLPNYKQLRKELKSKKPTLQERQPTA